MYKINNLYWKMFLVDSNNQTERIQLQQQFSSRNGHFLVPLKQSPIIAKMIRSVAYQFFQDNLPAIASKIKQFALNVVNMSISLNQFRQIMEAINREQQQLKLYRSHLIEINKFFSDRSDQLNFNSNDEINRSNDLIFEEALKGHHNLTEIMENVGNFIPAEYETEIIEEIAQQQTQKSVESQLCSISTNCNINEVGDNYTDKLANFFSSASSIFRLEPTQDPKSDQKKVNDSSQLLTSFKKQPSPIISQTGMGKMIYEQLKQEVKREICLGKTANKHDYQQKTKYNKMIRETLLLNKLKPRKKK